MNRLIPPVCLVYVLSLCGTAFGTEPCPSAACPQVNDSVVVAPAAPPAQPIRAKCRKAADNTLAIVSAPIVVPVLAGTLWCAYTMPKCVSKVRSAFPWNRARSID